MRSATGPRRLNRLVFLSCYIPSGSVSLVRRCGTRRGRDVPSNWTETKRTVGRTLRGDRLACEELPRRGPCCRVAAMRPQPELTAPGGPAAGLLCRLSCSHGRRVGGRETGDSDDPAGFTRCRTLSGVRLAHSDYPPLGPSLFLVHTLCLTTKSSTPSACPIGHQG